MLFSSVAICTSGAAVLSLPPFYLELMLCHYYDIQFRIMRFPADDGKYVSVATNLSAEEFTISEIKQLYKRHRGLEIGFRELKYTIGLINWHSRKTEEILRDFIYRVA